MLPQMRERSAGTAQTNVGHLNEGARLPCDRQARLPALHLRRFFTRSPCFFVRPKDSSHSRYPGSIGAAVHPKLSKPLKAGPSSGPDGDRASWDEIASLACRRRTLLRQINASRWRPQLSKAWRVYRDGKRKEGLFELRCELLVESGKAEFLSWINAFGRHDRATAKPHRPVIENYFRSYARLSTYVRSPSVHCTPNVSAKPRRPSGVRRSARVSRIRASQPTSTEQGMTGSQGRKRE